MTHGDEPAVAVGWLDCSSGVSGDMLLGALVDLGALDLRALAAALDLDVTLTSGRGSRGALVGTAVTVAPGGEQPHRRLDDVLALVDGARVDAEVRARATAVFRRLADAEARVHGTSADEVEFHEVGAVDAIVDVVGACAGLHELGLDRLVVSTVALGGGHAHGSHGPIPVPGPAVLELLAASALVGAGGPVDVELATPTGVALLAELADATGHMPTLAVDRVGIGLGARDLAEQPNAVRLVVGTAASPDAGAEAGDWLLLEANVDDLDPRLWPSVLTHLLEAGAADAWLTPILMKKGRPAHTVSALVAAGSADAAARVLFAESSTIGVRTTTVGKRALPRTWATVDVAGQAVRVKLAHLDGALVNAVPEYDDVVAAAAALGRPAKSVLADAVAAAANLRADD